MNIYFKALSYLIAIAAVLGGLWWYGDTKYDEGYAVREAIAVQAELEATKQAEEKRKQMQSIADKAQRKANERAKILETDSANARIAANKLRNENTRLRSSLSSLTREAIDRYANAASIVLTECTDAYTGLAEQADKIDNDRRQLEEAWPTLSKP